MSNSILRCVSLAKSYSDGKSVINVLKSINLDVAPGEMVSVVGSSGSGKSTLLHLLAGLDQPTSGKVMLNENCLHDMSEEENAVRAINSSDLFINFITCCLSFQRWKMSVCRC